MPTELSDNKNERTRKPLAEQYQDYNYQVIIVWKKKDNVTKDTTQNESYSYSTYLK